MRMDVGSYPFDNCASADGIGSIKTQTYLLPKANKSMF